MSRTSDWRVIRRLLLTSEDSELRESLANSCRVLFRAPKSEHGKRMGSVDTVHRQKRNVRLLVLGLLIMAASVPGSGQWINYPTAGVPKNADGTPNLNAPPPRLPDGKPDFSGIWHAATINKCNPATGEFCGIEIGGSPLALNIGKELPGGLPFQPWAAELVKHRYSKDDPHVRCLPDNPPRTWVMPHLTKIVHTPQLLVMLYEVNAMYRQIFIDGRPLPEDPNPSWNGYSTAKWDQDTLVIQTNGFRDDLWIDMAGAPLTSAGKMTERLRRPTWGTLEVEITVDDPKVYTHPWTASLKEARELNIELIDEVCLENERSWKHMQTSQPAKQDYK
jgi:hypothetical protein